MFGVALMLGIAGWLMWLPRVPSWIAAGATFCGFVVVVGVHDWIDRRRETESTRRDLLRHQFARFQRRWADVPVLDVEPTEAFRATAADLDLFSHGGLYTFVCRAHTPIGRSLLRDWFCSPASPDEIKNRQLAVEHLATDEELREQLDLHGRLLSESRAGPTAFVEWAEGPRWSAARPWLGWLTLVLTCLMAATMMLTLAGMLPKYGLIIMMVLVGVNVLVNSLVVGGVHELLNSITAGRHEVTHYASLFNGVDGLADQPPKLGELKARMHVGGDFSIALTRLMRIVRLGNGRHSSAFAIPYYFVQILFFWDCHVLRWLEAWQAQYGKSIRGWVQSVGELESLCSLAAVVADHPQWSFPTVQADRELFSAEQLGHPLLPPATCCRNDTTLGPPGSFLLVTGSNMSGKSTLLRSVGVNAVLALAGGPVCADALEMPYVELATSMRVTDSLNDGVSFFLAELQRLKEIVDQARSLGHDDSDNPRKLLFLLDEILQGTNSAERHIAVAKIIEHLVAEPAIGAVSTHDLELADSPTIRQRCQTVHFREQFHDDGTHKSMTFDYQLRTGVSPTTNALKLLALVGLSD